MNKFGRIYAVICPIDGSIKYIGKTKRSMNDRIVSHWRDSHNLHYKTDFHRWLCELTEMPKFIVLADNVQLDELLAVERMYIIMNMNTILNIKDNPKRMPVLHTSQP